MAALRLAPKRDKNRAKIRRAQQAFTALGADESDAVDVAEAEGAEDVLATLRAALAASSGDDAAALATRRRARDRAKRDARAIGLSPEELRSLFESDPVESGFE